MSRTKTEGRILRARTQLLLDAPFFGQLAMRLTFIDASKWCPTAATDGMHFYYNEEFLDKLEDDELAFVFAHEVLHCVYRHVGPGSRCGDRNPKLWNFAGDFVINIELKDQGIGAIPNLPLLLDEKYRGYFTEQVYEELYQQNQKNKEAFKKMIGDGNFDMHIDGENGQHNGDGSDNGEQRPCKAGDLPAVLDEDDLKELAEKFGYDKDGKEGPVPMTQDQAENLGEDWEDAARNAARGAGAGNIPGGVQRLLKDLSVPKMDWRELVNAQLKSLMTSDYTFMRPSRKTWGSDIMLPGMDNDDMIDIAICVDTSGSICDEMLRDFLTEVQGIMEEFQNFRLRFWFFDTATYTKYEFTSDNVTDIADVGLVIEGGGGTDFDVNWNYLKEADIVPNQLIMFTDGYPFGSWGDEDYCDTLFVIHGSESIVSPFGISVYYDRHEN